MHLSEEFCVVKKKLKPETISFFNLGYMDNDGIVNFAFSEFFFDNLKRMKDPTKRFRNHILIPIFDLWGNIVSVYGRNLSSGTKCDSVPFAKSEVLYGLCWTAKDILKKGFATIVEGPFDLMVLYQEGIKNVVSTLGTSLSMSHLVLLSFFTDTLILMFDGDKAGYDRMIKTYTMYKGLMNILFCMLPQRFDPDEFVIKYGKDELTKRIVAYEDLVDNQIKQKLLC